MPWLGPPWAELLAGAGSIVALEFHGKFDEQAPTEKTQNYGSDGKEPKQPPVNVSQADNENDGEIIASAMMPYRRINALVVSFIGLYSVFAASALAYLLLSHGEAYFTTESDTNAFNVRTGIPLFCAGVVFFAWKAAATLRYMPIARLDNRIYKSPLALLAQWGFCLALGSNVELVANVTVRPFLHWFGADGHPWAMGHSDVADLPGLLATVVFWTLALSLAVGASLMLVAAYFLRFFSGAYCIVYGYEYMRPYLRACRRGRDKREEASALV